MGVRHIKALTSSCIDVIAIADCERCALDRASSDAPGAAAYTDWAELLERHQPDLVTVATTSPAHESVVVAAADAGVPSVLCEKPIATSLRAARAMAAACSRNGTRLVVNHPRRMLPAYLAIREALAADRFGDLRFMRVTCGAAGLANVGSHAFDLMRWFLGAPRTVIGRLEAETPPNPRGPAFCDPGGHGTFWFADERRATFDFSNDFSTSLVAEFGCRYGSITVDERNAVVRATARGDEGRAQPLHLYQTPMAPVELAFGPPIDIVQLTAAMIDNALSAVPAACNAADGIAALEMVAAVHLSHHANAPVDFPVTDDEDCLARIP